ncbi:Spc110p NDAI_0B05520 [Naumovozyma dairenensis CBS 421]|uniref:Spindle pole body component 110 n=1 Tax=Naumovozyma dairenensis (strain ATCC 10597 / BCRC 20456 / CBS 421 / NBRC 0211 / NRRL Y-12639) TaxID=1071378 RepID=G0W724_NAUDC|nr:hypothetical protein NDAI_0B05520 [Naumovozyma dairenensis CBS 421]CCD23585.1 hypothetical protein NDAI_0B05520 [Naumovozyma dairenensis CBS 421]
MNQPPSHLKDTAFKKLEFTPIGTDKRSNNSPTKSPSMTRRAEGIVNDAEFFNDEEPPRKIRRTSLNDTVNSLAILNQEEQDELSDESDKDNAYSSEFDDTIPKIPEPHDSNNIQNNGSNAIHRNNENKDDEYKKNLMPELSDNIISSKPLKQQQEEVEMLIKENHTLKIRIRTLVNFFNGFDLNTLKNMDIIDEIGKWKQKYINLNTEYNTLKLKYDDLNLNSEKHSEAEVKIDKKKEAKLVKEHKVLQDSFNQTRLALDTLQNQFKKLQEEKAKADHEIRNLTTQHHEELDTKLSQLDRIIAEKDDLINKDTAKIHKLEEQLNSLNNDTTSQSTIDSLKKQLIEEKSMLERVKTENETLENKIHDLKSQLRESEIELKALSEKCGRYETEIRDHKSTSEKSNNYYKNKINELESKIKNLHLQLENLNTERQELQDALLGHDIAGSDELRGIKEDMQNELEKIKQLEETNHTLQINFDDLQKDNSKLTRNLKNSEENKKTLEIQVQSMQQTIDNLEKASIQLTSDLKKLTREVHDLNEKDVDSQEQISRLQDKIEKLKSVHKEELKIVNEELDGKRKELIETNFQIKQLQNQLFENVKNSTTSDINEKVIKEKQDQIEDLQRKLADLRDAIRTDQNKNLKKFDLRIKETEMKYTEELGKLKEDVRLLKNERAKLKNQLETIKESKVNMETQHDRELNEWISKFNSMSKEHNNLINRQDNKRDSYRNEIMETLNENKRLLAQLEALQNQRSDMEIEITKLSKSRDAYKDTLKNTLSNLDSITKEFSEYKRRNKNNDEKNESMSDRYQNMQEKLMRRINQLEDDNLLLERRLQNQPLSSRGTNDAERFSNASVSKYQDNIDYYKLKYNMEVQQNNDMRLQIDYLNLILKMISRNDKLNYLKAKDDIYLSRENKNNDADPIPRYNPYYNDSLNKQWSNNYEINPFNDFYRNNNEQRFFDRRDNQKQLKFKSVALLVLACIRMKRVANKHRWDRQRLRYLERKIALNDDTQSW